MRLLGFLGDKFRVLNGYRLGFRFIYKVNGVWALGGFGFRFLRVLGLLQICVLCQGIRLK